MPKSRINKPNLFRPSEDHKDNNSILGLIRSIPDVNEMDKPPETQGKLEKHTITIVSSEELRAVNIEVTKKPQHFLDFLNLAEAIQDNNPEKYAFIFPIKKEVTQQTRINLAIELCVQALQKFDLEFKGQQDYSATTKNQKSEATLESKTAQSDLIKTYEEKLQQIRNQLKEAELKENKTDVEYHKLKLAIAELHYVEHLSQNNINKSIEVLQDALHIFKEIAPKNQPLLAHCLLLLAKLHFAAKDFKNAIAIFKEIPTQFLVEAINNFKFKPNKHLVEFHRELMHTFAKSADAAMLNFEENPLTKYHLKAAIQYYNAALQNYFAIPMFAIPEEAEETILAIQFNLVYAYLLDSNYDGALKQFDYILLDFDCDNYEIENFKIFITQLVKSGKDCELKGDLNKSITIYENALTILEKMLKEVADDKSPEAISFTAFLDTEIKNISSAVTSLDLKISPELGYSQQKADEPSEENSHTLKKSV